MPANSGPFAVPCGCSRARATARGGRAAPLGGVARLCHRPNAAATRAAPTVHGGRPHVAPFPSVLGRGAVSCRSSRAPARVAGGHPVALGSGASVRSVDGDIEGAVRDRRFRDGARLAIRAIEAGENPDHRAIGGIIQGLAASGQHKLVVELFESCRSGPEFRPTYNMCHTTCLAMVHCGRVQPACDLLRGMGALLGTEPSVITVTAVITALCKQARRRGLRTAQAAYSLWRDLHGRCERPGDAAHAGEGPAHLDAPAMRAGMQACALAGRMREAEEVLLQLRAAGGVDVRAFNILCSGYAGLRDLEAVQGMLARMAEAGVEPSDVTFNTLVAAYTRLGRMDLARESLQRLKESAGGKLSRQHCWAYSALIKGHVEQGDMEGVEATLEEMRSCGVAPGRVTYGTLVDGYVKARDLSRAEAVVREAHEQGVKLTAREYNPLLWGHCQPNAIGDDSGEVRAHGGVEKALRLLQEMQDQGVEATAETYNILMHGFMKDGDPHGSISLFESMCRVRIQPDAISYTCAVRALTESGDYQGAEAMFKRALEDATIEVDERLLCTMMHCYARAGAMSRAEKLMGRLDDLDARRRPSGAAWQRTKLKAFAILIGGYCNVQDVDKALDATKRLYEDGLEPDDAIFSQLMDLFVRTGEWRRALQVVGAMERVGVAADKKRIRELFLRIHTREEHERRRTGELIRDGDAGGARSKCRELERFKFWLGMPNDYYETDWAW